MDFQPDIETCLQVLQSGGIILYPTDTIWGIGCDATNAAAVSKIYALKQREETKSLIILMADEREVLKYTSQPDLRVFDFLKQQQKPTTVIYEGPMGLAPNLSGSDNTIAIRLVQEPFCRHLIKRLRRPIVSTSANISGQPAPAHFGEVAPAILSGVDYAVQYRREDRSPAQPSAIIKWGSDATVTVIRS